MLKREFTLHSQFGFHLRPAQVMAEKTGSFSSEINVKKADGTEVNAKSLLGLMSLGLTDGQTILVTAAGNDEKEAMQTIEELFRTNFGE